MAGRPQLERALRVVPLEHDLTRHFEALRAIGTRRALVKTSLYAEIRGELDRVLAGVERGDHPEAQRLRPAGLRVAAWNIQRGARFDAILATLAGDPRLREADVLLLVEVDIGMARSGNRNVARRLAEELGMSYAFGVSYLALEDDFGENPAGKANTLALAGSAILSRVPLGRVENVDLPELRDKFSSSEKRLGRKRALLAELQLDDGPLVVAACHLDSTASPAERGVQLDAMLARVDASGVPRALVGGDFNTTTWDTSTTAALARDVAHKLFVTGFRNTIDNYMTPGRRYEEPVFAALARHGFSIADFNEGGAPTMRYDVHDPYVVATLRTKVGSALTWLLQRRLRTWKGVVPARLDWLAGRGISARQAAVIDLSGDASTCPSDHLPIIAELA